MTLLSQRFPRVDLLRDVADDLEASVGPGSGFEGTDIGEALEEVVAVLRHYVVPRLEDGTAPFNVVFAGPTGSGKSTLVNSVVGRPVSAPGVVRPTTTRPLFYAKKGIDEPRALGPVDVDIANGDARILQFISLVDTPDIDSTRIENRRAALDVIAGADLVVFVSSALRYADLVPWEVFRSVSERGIPSIHVLNRVTSESTGARVDYAKRLREEGVGSEPMCVMEHRIDGRAILPTTAVSALRTRILDMVGRIDRAACLDRSMDVVNSDLDSIAYRLNAGLVRTGRTGPATGPHARHRDMDRLVASWRERADAVSGVGSRVFGRRNRVAELDLIGREIRQTLISTVERDVRLAARVGGDVVIDLTGDDLTVHLTNVDDAVREWFESLGDGRPTEDLRPGALQRRIESAIGEAEAVISGGGAGGDLGKRIESIYEDVGESIVSATDAAGLLDEVQRARARTRPDA